MFDFFRKIDLSFVGEGWEQDCYIKIREVTMAEVEQFAGLSESTDPAAATKLVTDVISEKFVEGFGIQDGKRVAFTKEDVASFPPAVLFKVLTSLNDGLDKKKLTTLNMPSEDSPESNSQTN